jgi:hypothetical protein
VTVVAGRGRSCRPCDSFERMPAHAALCRTGIASVLIHPRHMVAIWRLLFQVRIHSSSFKQADANADKPQLPIKYLLGGDVLTATLSDSLGR